MDALWASQIAKLENNNLTKCVFTKIELHFFWLTLLVEALVRHFIKKRCRSAPPIAVPSVITTEFLHTTTYIQQFYSMFLWPCKTSKDPNAILNWITIQTTTVKCQKVYIFYSLNGSTFYSSTFLSATVVVTIWWLVCTTTTVGPTALKQQISRFILP